MSLLLSLLVLVAAIVLVTFVALLWRRAAVSVRRRQLRGRHVLVTGGSSGIGLSTAVLAAKYGARVTVLARDVDRLAAARKLVAAAGASSSSRDESDASIDERVLTVSCDVAADFTAVVEAVNKAERTLGAIDTVICCAGYAVARRFEELPLPQHRRLMDVNYFGAVNVLHTIVPRMRARGSGRICIVSSMGGLVGLWGFSGYCGAKFALVGLAQVLLQEVRAFGVSVTVCCPPDTDTPGFAEENRDKPAETRLVSESAGLATADQMASQLIDDTLAGRFSCTMGVEGFAGSTLALGCAPVNSCSQLVLQLLTWPLFRVMMLWTQRGWHKVIEKLARQKEADKKLC